MTEPNDEDRERAQAVIDAWLDDDGPDDECDFIAREFAAVRAAERERIAEWCYAQAIACECADDTMQGVRNGAPYKKMAAAIREGK